MTVTERLRLEIRNDWHDAMSVEDDMELITKLMAWRVEFFDANPYRFDETNDTHVFEGVPKAGSEREARRGMAEIVEFVRSRLPSPSSTPDRGEG